MLCLVNPPCDGNVGSLRNLIYPPFNLGILSAFLCDNNIQNYIIDGNIFSMSEIEDKLSLASVVAIGCNALNINNASSLAGWAKSKNKVVIIGGTFVNRYSFRFLPRDHCDAIIFGDAEYSLLNFVSKHNECSNQNDRAILLKNNNLFDESVMDQLKCELNICKHKFPDYSTLDLSVYHKRFKEIYNKDYKIFDLALPCLSVKGCAWRSATGGCVFCAIPHKKKQNICAKMFWENIIRLHNQYGADYFWEVGDSFLDDICWLQEIRNNKPNIDFVYGLEVYARSDYT